MGRVGMEANGETNIYPPLPLYFSFSLTPTPQEAFSSLPNPLPSLNPNSAFFVTDNGSFCKCSLKWIFSKDLFSVLVRTAKTHFSNNTDCAFSNCFQCSSIDNKKKQAEQAKQAKPFVLPVLSCHRAPGYKSQTGSKAFHRGLKTVTTAFVTGQGRIVMMHHTSLFDR